MARSISPWTVRAFFCFCQPLYRVPAYSMVSLNLGTRLHDNAAMSTHKPVHAANLPKPVGPYSPGMNFDRLDLRLGPGRDRPGDRRAGRRRRRDADRAVPEERAGDPRRRRIRSAARAALRRVPDRHEGVPADERRLRADVRRASSGADHDPGGGAAGRRACGSRSTASPTCHRIDLHEDISIAACSLARPRVRHRVAAGRSRRRGVLALQPHSQGGDQAGARRRSVGPVDPARAAGVGAGSRAAPDRSCRPTGWC